jgi:spermidine synthase
MKPWEVLDVTRAPDGTDIRLARHDDEYLILANGKPLMSSLLHGSEEALATLGCREARALEQPRVLVGGLGMGFTLRAVLNLLPAGARVTVAELLPAVIDWNRAQLGPLAAHPLNDRRVRIDATDVGFTLRANPGQFDVVLLDVDNGPAAFTATNNAGLYEDGGIAAAYAALRVPGTLAIWSAWEDRDFEQRLRVHGFEVNVERARAHARRSGSSHTIFVARKTGRPLPRRGRRTTQLSESST